MLCHHLGTGASPLGTVGASGEGDPGWASTRWADWLDLLTPVAVLTPAAGALAAARAQRISWILFWVGVVLYIEGHGIRLAGNSIADVAPGPTAHLWDEVVGHHLWYGGFFVVVAALLRALDGHAFPQSLTRRCTGLSMPMA